MDNIPEAPAQFVAECLGRITLPSLLRPPVSPDADPTEDLVFWGITKYAYSLIVHFRTILKGILLLSETGNEPSVIILGRHLYEWNMQASYAYQKFQQHLQQVDLKSAWELFLAISEGNSWIKQHGRKYAPEFPNEIIDRSTRLKHFAKAYKAYRLKEYGSEKVDDDYSYLSEHSHPNGFCLQPYCEIHPPSEVRFVEPRSNKLPGVLHSCTMEWMLIMARILGLAHEETVQRKLVGILREIATAARASAANGCDRT
jgi:hypothetical protein